MEGNLRFGTTEKTLLQQVVTYLHRLVGARLHVQMREVKKDELSFNLGEVVSIRFMNRGLRPLLIDNAIILLTGETYIEGDTAGPGINHSYKLEFMDENPGKTPLGISDKPFVYDGAHVSVRALYRKY
ncbi:MAG: hypothetical protein ACI81P_003699 [Neolewinella sp.]|jgi:hypothetical protein